MTPLDTALSRGGKVKRVFKVVRASESERFWIKVRKGKPDECWIWAGGICNGYGIFQVSNPNKLLRAHRYVLLGRRKSKLHVLHKCHVPTCVNPRHLYLGTPQDNSNDAVKSGRSKTMGVPDKWRKPS